MSRYFENYLLAIKKPLLSLRKTFEIERGFLKGRLRSDSVVLEVGCGVGRPMADLARFARSIVGIDNDSRALKIARVRCKKIQNVELRRMNALKMGFSPGSFDLVYSTYNLIGSVDRKDIPRFVSEMVRVAKKGGQVINITWKNDPQVTRFLNDYYPSIGLDVLALDQDRTVTNKGIFHRLSKQELLGQYRKAGLKKIRFFEIEPVWRAVVRTK